MTRVGGSRIRPSSFPCSCKHVSDIFAQGLRSQLLLLIIEIAFLHDLSIIDEGGFPHLRAITTGSFSRSGGYERH